MPFVLWEILLPLIIAFLLGLLFGWLWWGWRRTKITYTEWETMRQKANRSSAVETEAELAEVRADRDRLQAELDAQREAAESEAALGTGVLGLSGAADAEAATETAEAATEAADAETAAPVEAAPEAEAEAEAVEAEAAPEAEAEAEPVETDAVAATAEGERAVEGERHPYGEGSHAPFADDRKAQPEGYDIKGNADSMLYHRPDSRSYKATIAEVWFDTPERAEAAGFSLANSHPKD